MVCFWGLCEHGGAGGTRAATRHQTRTRTGVRARGLRQAGKKGQGNKAGACPRNKRQRPYNRVLPSLPWFILTLYTIRFKQKALKNQGFRCSIFDFCIIVYDFIRLNFRRFTAVNRSCHHRLFCLRPTVSSRVSRTVPGGALQLLQPRLCPALRSHGRSPRAPDRSPADPLLS